MSGHHVFRGAKGIVYASTLERDFIIRTEFFLDVTDIVAHPIIVDFEAGRSSQRFSPAFLVRRRRSPESVETPKPELVDVTPQFVWRRHWPKWRRKWKAAIRAANARGWRFTIHDEARIRDQALLNIQRLSRYKRTTIETCVSERIQDDLGRIGVCSVATLLERHFASSSQTYGLQQVWALLSQRHIDCRISLPLDTATEVWLAGEQ